MKMIEQIGTAPMEVALLGAFTFILGAFTLILGYLLRGRCSPMTGGRRLEPNLPLGYRLRRDPDLLHLLKPDGSVAAAFSAKGANEEAVELAAWEDRGGGDPSFLVGRRSGGRSRDRRR